MFENVTRRLLQTQLTINWRPRATNVRRYSCSRVYLRYVLRTHIKCRAMSVFCIRHRTLQHPRSVSREFSTFATARNFVLLVLVLDQRRQDPEDGNERQADNRLPYMKVTVTNPSYKASIECTWKNAALLNRSVGRSTSRMHKFVRLKLRPRRNRICYRKWMRFHLVACSSRPWQHAGRLAADVNVRMAAENSYPDRTVNCLIIFYRTLRGVGLQQDPAVKNGTRDVGVHHVDNSSGKWIGHKAPDVTDMLTDARKRQKHQVALSSGAVDPTDATRRRPPTAANDNLFVWSITTTVA